MVQVFNDKQWTGSGDSSQHATASDRLPVFIDASDGVSLSWPDIAGHIADWRRLAHDSGLRPGDRVALVVADPLTFVSAYFACLSIGLTAVPIDPRTPSSELETSFGRLFVSVVASDCDDIVFAGTVFPLHCSRWRLNRGGAVAVLHASSGYRGSSAAGNQPAVVLMSSGTTGSPKGVPLSSAQLFRAARRIADHHEITSVDRGYSALPLFHVNAQVVGLLTTLVSGGSLVLSRRFDRHQFWHHAEEFAPTWLNTVPGILDALLSVAPPDEAVLGRIRFARSASAPLPLETNLGFAMHTGIGVLETYGMTEAASQITANSLTASERRIGSVGQPVGVELRIVDDDGRVMRVEEEGQVELHGSTVVSEYLEFDGDGTEHTRSARNRDGWLPTGDTGYRDHDGFVYLVGRTDDVINRGGEKFHPGEIEAVLVEHPAVSAAAVVGAPHPRLGQVPVAYLTVAGEQMPDLEASLHLLCAQRLADYKQPIAYRVVDAMPLGSTGKILRRVLRDRPVPELQQVVGSGV